MRVFCYALAAAFLPPSVAAPMFTEATVGNLVEVNCSVETPFGFGFVTNIVWSNEISDDVVSQDQGSRVHQIRLTGPSAAVQIVTLRITKAAPTDTDVYFCTAKNKMFSASASTVVNINGMFHEYKTILLLSSKNLMRILLVLVYTGERSSTLFYGLIGL